MNRTLSTALAFTAALLVMLTACSKRNQADGVIGVEANDPEMVAAIAKARSTLPQFWQVFEKRERGEEKFALKVMITDKHGTEHFWVNQLERHDGKTTGAINNDPETVTSVKLGERIDIPEADISDWMYIRDGKMVGNATAGPLLKRMPPEEAARLKSMMADP